MSALFARPDSLRHKSMERKGLVSKPGRWDEEWREVGRKAMAGHRRRLPLAFAPMGDQICEGGNCISAAHSTPPTLAIRSGGLVL